MKIIVTGGLGFVGINLIKLALSRGHKIINIDAMTYASSKNNKIVFNNMPNYVFEKVNINNRKRIDQIFKTHSPDAVMHLAAESHVDRSIDKPEEFIKSNVVGTFNLLEASLKYWNENGNFKSFRFHHISTDEVFGSLPHDPKILFTEDSIYKPSSPYSASKASADHLVKAWHQTFKLPIIITNCSNNFGPYQLPEKLFPLTIINALSEKQLPVYGDGSHIRDWLYVEDHVKALLLVLEHGKIGRSYNVGSNNEKSNLEIVKMICSTLDNIKSRHNGKYSDLICFVKDRPGHDSRYGIDAKRIKKELGWRPVSSFEESVKKTVKWYLNNKSWWSDIIKIRK